jgi:hypothetical protein
VSDDKRSDLALGNEEALNTLRFIRDAQELVIS